MRVEIVSDVVCPWCYIGKRRFERAVTELRADGVTLDPEVVYRAFQLDPSAPHDETTPVRDAYAKRFGGAARADEILQHVSGIARREGIHFNMDLAIRANTMRAHRLLKIVGKVAPDKQANVNEAVMKAYFCEGSYIDDSAVLAECAARAGFSPEGLEERLAASDDSREDVERDLTWATERDITAVPAFVVNDSLVIPGAQDVETFKRLLTRMKGSGV